MFFNIKKLLKNVERIDFFSNFAEIFEYILCTLLIFKRLS